MVNFFFDFNDFSPSETSSTATLFHFLRTFFPPFSTPFRSLIYPLVIRSISARCPLRERITGISRSSQQWGTTGRKQIV